MFKNYYNYINDFNGNYNDSIRNKKIYKNIAKFNKRFVKTS